MKVCSVCQFEAGSGAALASHMRWKHPAPSADDGDGPNLRAVKVTIGELVRLGRIEKVDEAFLEALLTLAATLDCHPTSANLWREYRETLSEVLQADEEADDELAAALARINSAAAVGDSPAS